QVLRGVRAEPALARGRVELGHARPSAQAVVAPDTTKATSLEEDRVVQIASVGQDCLGVPADLHGIRSLSAKPADTTQMVGLEPGLLAANDDFDCAVLSHERGDSDLGSAVCRDSDRTHELQRF